MEKDYFVRKAILLALRGRGKAGQNPPAGAVLVKRGAVMGAGYRENSELQAEVKAIENATSDIRGATLYCTLEPNCDARKKRISATRRIISEGIIRVVIGCLDPNKKVNGKGIKELLEAGIDVEYGILEDDCRYLIREYSHLITTGRPFIAVTVSASLDGYGAAVSEVSKQIAGAKAGAEKMRFGAQYDAVLVGKGIFCEDDQSLDIRKTNGRNLFRIVIDADLNAAPDYDRFRINESENMIVLCGDDLDDEKYKSCVKPEVNILPVPRLKNGRLNLRVALQSIAGHFPITSIIVDSGAPLVSELLKLNLVDKVYWFTVPKIIGKGISAIKDLSGENINEAKNIVIENIEIVEDQALFIGSPEIKEK